MKHGLGYSGYCGCFGYFGSLTLYKLIFIFCLIKLIIMMGFSSFNTNFNGDDAVSGRLVDGCVDLIRFHCFGDGMAYRAMDSFALLNAHAIFEE